MSFLINNQAFKIPSSLVEVPKVQYKNKWRSINNTLNVDILNFPTKKEYIVTWNVLDTAQFSNLLNYIDSGFYSVVSTISGHSFNFSQAWLELLDEVEHGFNGQRENIRVRISQK